MRLTVLRRRWFSWLALLAAVLLQPTRVPASDSSERVNIEDAMRDGTGRIWAIGKDQRILFIYGENSRQQVLAPSGLGENPRAICLGRRADGAIICLWVTDQEKFQFSEYLGDHSQLFAPCSLNLDDHVSTLRLTGDSKGNMWLTQQGPDIYRIDHAGVPALLHSISPGERLLGSFYNSAGTFWSMVCVCEDADGRLWFWSDHADGPSNTPTIHSVLLYDGRNFVQKDLVFPVERAKNAPACDCGQETLTALAPKDTRHLWIARPFAGLYTLNTSTCEVESVPGQPEASGETSLILRENDHGWLFVMGRTLWRLTDGTHWNKLIDGLDAGGASDHRQDRLWVPAPHGHYLGSNFNGLWFLPDDGTPPHHLDWRQGFPLATPFRLLELPDNRWLAVEAATGATWVGRPDALTGETHTSGQARMTLVHSEADVVPDSRRHLWALFSGEARTLHEWDGERWVEHDLPATTAKAFNEAVTGIDRTLRVWLMIALDDRWQWLIYDSAQDRWQLFDGYQKALEAQLSLGRQAEIPDGPDIHQLARFGPSRQICYLSGHSSKLAWFDGEGWSHWTPAEVTGGRVAGSFDGPPFFGAAGRLRVNINEQTWEHTEGEDWRRMAESEPGFADAVVRSAVHECVELSSLPVKDWPDSAAMDNEGICWITQQHQLYRFHDGFYVPVFDPGEQDPFLDGRRVDRVHIDARGNAFVRSNDQEDIMILATSKPPPHTSLMVSPSTGQRIPADTVIIHLASDATPLEGKTHFDWRLDGGTWQPLAAGQAATVELDAVPSGEHRFEARSIDAALQTDTTPAVLTFEVHINPDAQIAGYIAQLADPDFSRRKAAVEALARQPARAFLALKAARLKVVDDSERWWMDAALQEIERTTQAGTGNLGVRHPSQSPP